MIILATCLMLLLVACIVASCIDVWRLAEHESRLAELWDDDEDPWVVETRAEIESLPEIVA